METRVMQQLVPAIQGLGVPDVLDGRGYLATNPGGLQWPNRDPEALRGLVWHQALSWGSVEAVARYHTGANSHLYPGGVESIAYTWAIRRNGQIVLCNDFDKAVWSHGYAKRPGNENAEFVSVMFEGLFDGPHLDDPSAGQPTYLQMLAGLALWHVCKDIWRWHDDALYGHYLLGKPACPGAALETMVAAIRSNAPVPGYELTTVQGRQEALKALGYYTGAVDGLWGPESKGALMRFQSDHGLLADGVWGAATEAAVKTALRALSPVPAYDFTTVEGRQEALKALGYYTGAVDGLWGAQSKEALIRFQSEHALVADGVWGPKTEAAVLQAHQS